jgi:hypothetical protein
MFLVWKNTENKSIQQKTTTANKNIDNLFWEKLILNYKQNGYISNGLTIPYLVGVMNIGYNSPADKETLTQLINLLIDNPTENKPFLQYCSNDDGDGINEFVVALKSKEECDRNFKNNLVFKNVQLIKTFYIAENAKTFGETKDDIIDSLWNKYGKIIEGKFFSWDSAKQEWHNFSQNEKNRIYKVVQ